MLVLLDARERQQIVDQAAHAASFHRHDVKELVARFRVFLGVAFQSLDEAGERGQWRAQFVARIGDEIGAQLLRTFSSPSDRAEAEWSRCFPILRARHKPDRCAAPEPASSIRPTTASPVSAVLRIASSTAGARMIAEICLRSASIPTTPRIALLARITRSDVSIKRSGSGRRSNRSRAIGGRIA